jgi:hypothetical protein
MQQQSTVPRAGPAPQGGRLDVRTAQQVVQLAGRLQARHEECLSVAEVVAIGEEVGLRPEFLQAALAEVRAIHRPPPPREGPVPATLMARAVAAWVAGWVVPILGAVVPTLLGASSLAAGGLLFLGAALWVGGAAYLTVQALAARRRPPPPPPPPEYERASLLEQLHRLQQQVAAQERKRAYLAVAATGEEGQPAPAPTAAAVDTWVAEVAGQHRGQTLPLATGGLLCQFEDEVQALRAARVMLDGLAWTLTERGVPPARLRCGVSAGMVPLVGGLAAIAAASPVPQRAAALLARAAPEEVLVDEEVVPEALQELGACTPVPPLAPGEKVFSCRPGGQPAPPA